jgi:hypothetical protein
MKYWEIVARKLNAAGLDSVAVTSTAGAGLLTPIANIAAHCPFPQLLSAFLELELLTIGSSSLAD